MIVLMMIFYGAIGGAGYAISDHFMRKWRNRWRTNNGLPPLR